MDQTFTIRLGSKLAAALQDEARHTGLSKGEIARQAIEARLGSKAKSSVMRRYFGTMEGHADLSTNKTYRRAWNRKPK